MSQVRGTNKSFRSQHCFVSLTFKTVALPLFVVHLHVITKLQTALKELPQNVCEYTHTLIVGMCGIRISVRFLKTRTEPNRSQKVKPEISVTVAFLKTELFSYK